MVHGAINIPAHSFYPTRFTWLNILGSIPMVLFYCGSSNGRGPRVAAWYQDTLDEAGVTTSEAIVLAGGIKGFVEKFQDLTDPVFHFPST
jgi:arsenical-resistance protein 2